MGNIVLCSIRFCLENSRAEKDFWVYCLPRQGEWLTLDANNEHIGACVVEIRHDLRVCRGVSATSHHKIIVHVRSNKTLDGSALSAVLKDSSWKKVRS